MNTKLFFKNLEKLQNIIYSGKMYSVEPDYTLLDKIRVIMNSLENLNKISENFEDLWDILEEYEDERSVYEENYAIFENRRVDGVWYDIYDGYDEDSGPDEIEDNSDIMKELIDFSIDDYSQVLEELKIVKALNLPEDIKRGIISKFFV